MAELDPKTTTLAGVFPVLPTPFDRHGQVDEAALRGLVRYLLHCGVDGLTYPGVASEVAQLTSAERTRLTAAVLDETAGRVPVIAGASSNDAATTIGLAREAMARGAAALMIAVPPERTTRPWTPIAASSASNNRVTSVGRRSTTASATTHA